MTSTLPQELERGEQAMKRAVGILCAGLLLLGAGCVWNVGNTRVEANVQVDQQAVDLAVDSAVARVQRELQMRGMEVTVNTGTDGVRVVSKTRSGDQFTVVFSRRQDLSGKEQTLVRVEWSTKPDHELWLGLLAALGPTLLEAAR
jgi:hypothetical protein